MAADIKALIYQYARQGFYRNIQTVCEEVIRKRGSTPVLQYWQAFGLYQEGELHRNVRSHRYHATLLLPAACRVPCRRYQTAGGHQV